MNRIDYFAPTANFDGLLPGLSMLSLALLFVFAAGFIFWQCQLQTNRITARRRFLVHADRLRLTRRERNLLYAMATKAGVNPLSKILTNQTSFENAVFKHRSLRHSADRSFLESLRAKIFDHTMEKGAQGNSTESMVPGSILTIRNIDRDSPVISGKVLDNDKMGLIVVLRSQPGIYLNIHPNDRLAVSAKLHKNDPVRFMTWVKSIIPGPRKMVVLSHSEYVSAFTNKFTPKKRKALEEVAQMHAQPA